MIDPRELRLGNYYWSSVAHDLRAVGTISYGYNSMVPILLNDKILPLLEFGYNDFDGRWYYDEISISKFKNKYYLDIDNIEVNHVHTLQNIVFSIYGKDIEVDENKFRDTIYADYA